MADDTLLDVRRFCFVFAVRELERGRGSEKREPPENPASGREVVRRFHHHPSSFKAVL